MIVVCQGKWDGVDANGKSVYGKLYDIYNLPELPDTLDGAKEELKYYKEYLDYYGDRFSKERVDELRKIRKIYRDKWDKSSALIEEEKKSFLSWIVKRKKLAKMEEESLQYFEIWEDAHKELEEYDSYKYIEEKYRETLKRISKYKKARMKNIEK